MNSTREVKQKMSTQMDMGGNNSMHHHGMMMYFHTEIGGDYILFQSWKPQDGKGKFIVRFEHRTS